MSKIGSPWPNVLYVMSISPTRTFFEGTSCIDVKGLTEFDSIWGLLTALDVWLMFEENMTIQEDKNTASKKTSVKARLGSLFLHTRPHIIWIVFVYHRFKNSGQ